MKSKIGLRGWVVAICSLPLLAPLVSAQSYPNRPVKIVVGYAAGGAVEIGTFFLTQMNADFTQMSTDFLF